MVKTVDEIYGHDALVLYLQDVRDLETMLYLFCSKIVEGDAAIEEAHTRYLTPNKVAIPEQSTAGKVGSFLAAGYLVYLLIFALGAAAYFFYTTLTNGFTAGQYFGNFVSIAILLVISFILFKVIRKSRKKWPAKREAAIAHNEEDDRRLAENRKIISDQYERPWQQKRAFLDQACKRVSGARAQCYALNIIPLQYRNLEAVQYLYDFMSTSRQPFAQALDHAQIENGIRRIEAKLNIVISQNEAQLRKLTRIESNTNTLIEQGNAILAAQVATAYYASSAAAHARAIDEKMDCMQSYIQYGF